MTGELLQKWNDDHPELAVKRGDRIAEVNGMKEWWMQNTELELVVKRSTEAGGGTERGCGEGGGGRLGGRG